MAPVQLSASSARSTPLANSRILDVLIIGGGLSGLFVGQGLTRLGANWRLLEARPVLGGRLANDKHLNEIDMGGAWLWPSHQPNVKGFLAEHSDSVQVFEQPDDPSSTRVEGGAVQLVHTLARDVDEERLVLNTPVTKCSLQSSSDHALVEVETANNETFRARTVVFAAPPKLIAKHVVFDPPLSGTKQAAMEASHTWMAGVTKISLIYQNRFWDLQTSNGGLPGGPAFQVYDSGTNDKKISALTFFALVPPNNPAFRDDKLLADQVAKQMAQVWNYQGLSDYSLRAHSYNSFFVQRWSKEKYISEDERPTRIHPHPHPVRALAQPEWNGHLQFAGSEADLSSPGVMEGAIGAAKRVLKALETRLAESLGDKQCSTKTP